MNKNHFYYLVALFFSSQSSHAKALSFKKETVIEFNWFPYILVLIFLFLILLFFKKNSLAKEQPQIQVIENKILHHKTRLYLIKHQEQQFLIADNQQALAIYPLSQ